GNNSGLAIGGSGNGDNSTEYFKNVLVEDNIIHGNGKSPGDTGNGMVFLSLIDSGIRNNLVYDNAGRALDIGDAFTGDLQSSNVQFYNNYFSGPVLIEGSHTTKLSFTNNIFSSPDSSAFTLMKFSEFPDAQLTLDNNLYYMPNKTGDQVIFY